MVFKFKSWLVILTIWENFIFLSCSENWWYTLKIYTLKIGYCFGIENWNNKAVFKSWQPQFCHAIKNNYPSLWNDSDDDTDVENNFETNGNNFLELFGCVPPLPSNIPMAAAANSTNSRFNSHFSNSELKEILSKMQ